MKPTLETLEPRNAPAVVTLDAAGLLLIQGDSGNDTVTVHEQGADFVIEHDDGVDLVPIADVKKMKFVGGKGDDFFRADVSADSLNKVVANGGKGNDVLIVNGASTWQGTAEINGNAGTDVVFAGSHHRNVADGGADPDVIWIHEADSIVVDNDSADFFVKVFPDEYWPDF